ncbi:MAG: cysteine hydrolase [Firmicutes bacterium]|nr:cysteine hydrolase [Bacillota bacterium]
MKTALLIVDIQNDYFPGGKMELSGSEEASLKAKSILEHFRKSGLPVIHIQHISVREGSTFFIPDTTGVKIHKNVTPAEGEKVFTKYYPSSFRETGLDEYLKSNGITNLVICGMMTHMCIDTTVRAAFDLGYTNILAYDACATRELNAVDGSVIPAGHVHNAFIAALGMVFAKTVKADEIPALLA